MSDTKTEKCQFCGSELWAYVNDMAVFKCGQEMGMRSEGCLKNEIANLNRDLTVANAEIARLKAGGCARDQRTTQFCAEVLKLEEENATFRSAIRQMSEVEDEAKAECLKAGLSELEVNGDSYGVPTVADLVEMLANKNTAARERIKRLEEERDAALAVATDPHALWANWLRGTVTLPAGIVDVRQYQERIKRLEKAGDAMAAYEFLPDRLAENWAAAKEAKP